VKDIITRTLWKIKVFAQAYVEEIGVSLAIVLVAISSFYLGKTSVVFDMEHPPIVIEEEGGEMAATSVSAKAASSTKDAVVATKSGKRYYLPWCPTVARLAESAKRHFASVAAAEAAGLTPAKNCAGMK